MVFGRPIPVAEIIGKVEAVDIAAVERAARRLIASRPTFATLGQVGQVDPYDKLVERLG